MKMKDNPLLTDFLKAHSISKKLLKILLKSQWHKKFEHQVRVLDYVK